MEALNYTTTTLALTGNQQFRQGKEQLLAWGYHNESLRQKLVFPEVTHFDDRLAFLNYYPLLRYERDPALRSIFRSSLERSWEIKRIENVPWFSFIEASTTTDRGLLSVETSGAQLGATPYEARPRPDIFGF